MKFFAMAVVAVASTVSAYLAMHMWIAPKLPLRKINVPQVVGSTPEQARGLLGPVGLLLVIDEERADGRVAAGAIAEQRPLVGSELHRGQEVHVVVARAVRKVPRLEGLALDAAKQALEDVELKVGRVSEVPSPTVAKGMVVEQKPAAGTAVLPSTGVELVLSAGPLAQPVPKVVGKSLGTAKQLLEKAGFALGAIRHTENDDLDANIVVKQTPAAEAPAPAGSKVDLVVNE